MINGQIEFSPGFSWKYLKGSFPSNLPGDWMTEAYLESGWSQGNAPFRYGDGTGGTVPGDMMNGYTTLYLRSSFNAFATDRIKTIRFRVNYDDGFVIWINGTNPSGNYSGNLANSGEEVSGTVTLRFISLTGVITLVRETGGTEVIDLAEAGIAPGVYTVAAEYRGVSYRARLVHMPDR